jgi:hypothetical protein
MNAGLLGLSDHVNKVSDGRRDRSCAHTTGGHDLRVHSHALAGDKIFSLGDWRHRYFLSCPDTHGAFDPFWYHLAYRPWLFVERFSSAFTSRTVGLVWILSIESGPGERPMRPEDFRKYSIFADNNMLP